MKIVIPGGSGQVGTILARAFQNDGHEVVVLSRSARKAPWRVVTWDAATLDKYITDPQAFIPGNRMAFAGITDRSQRDDLIAYLAVATR